MKKTILFLALILGLFNTANLKAAETVYDENPSQIKEFTYQEGNINITENLSVTYSNSNTNTNTKSGETNYVTVTKEDIIKNANGTKIAIFKLSATFAYDGSSSSCTNVSHQTTIINTDWEFLIAHSFKNGSTAYGSYTLRNTVTKQTVSNSLSISCDKNGNIS